MGPVTAISTCLRRSFRFSGRASRSEVWWFALLVAAFWLLPRYLVHIVGYRFRLGFFMIVFLCLLISYTSAMARRMHDQGRPGYLAILAVFSPILFAVPPLILSDDGFVAVGFMMIGVYIWPILMALIMSWPGDPGPNHYGPNPIEVIP